MDKRPFAVICIFFIIGIVLAACFPNLLKFIPVFITTLIFISLTLTLSLKRGQVTHVFLFLSIISVGALLYLNSNIFPPNHINYTFAPIAIGAQYSAQRTPSISSGGLHFLGKDKLKAEIIGVIKSPAETRGIYYGKVSSRYVFEIESISNLSDSVSRPPQKQWRATHGVNGLALIRIQAEKDYQYGDRLMVKGTIKRPFENVIASEAKQSQKRGIARNDKKIFNYRDYLENQNIFAIINTSEKNVTLLSHSYKVNPFVRFAYFVREKLKNQFLEKMPLESGAFLRAILLGDRSELPKKLNESFRNSGTMYILPIQNTKKLNYTS